MCVVKPESFFYKLLWTVNIPTDRLLNPASKQTIVQIHDKDTAGR